MLPENRLWNRHFEGPNELFERTAVAVTDGNPDVSTIGVVTRYNAGGLSATIEAKSTNGYQGRD